MQLLPRIPHVCIIARLWCIAPCEDDRARQEEAFMDEIKAGRRERKAASENEQIMETKGPKEEEEADREGSEKGGWGWMTCKVGWA
jgi:hypothetical protein